MPNRRCRYASSFLTSLTSTASLQSKSGLARVLGRDATNRQHELPKNFWDERGGKSAPSDKLEGPPQRPISESHGVDHLIHGARRLGTAGFADDLGRHACDRHVVRHRFDHDRARRDARAMADLDIAEDLRAGADQDAVTDFRMTVLVLLAGAAERDAMQDRDVVLDKCRLTADETGGVIEEDAAADARGGVDVGLEYRRRPALQIIRKILAALQIEPMREAVGLDGVKALEIEQRVDEARRRGVAVVNGDEIGAERVAEIGIIA